MQPPKKGDVLDGYTFLGGDPNKQENWELNVPKAGDVLDGYTFLGGDPNKQQNWSAEVMQPELNLRQIEQEKAAALSDLEKRVGPRKSGFFGNLSQYQAIETPFLRKEQEAKDRLAYLARQQAPVEPTIGTVDRAPTPEPEKPGIFEMFTDRQEAIRKGREWDAWQQEQIQRKLLEDMQTQTGFFDRLGDLIDRGILNIRSGAKDVEAVMESDPALKAEAQKAARIYAADAATEIEGTTKWEDVGLSNFLPFIAEVGAESIPYMFATALGAPGMISANLGMTGNIARGRAEADARQDVSGTDALIAAPFAVMSTALDAIGLGGILGAAGKTAATRILKAAAQESGTEGVQSALEYIGAQAGTQQGVDAGDLFSAITQGMVAGAGLGAGFRATGEAGRAAAKKAISRLETKPDEAQIAAVGRDVDTEFANLIRQEAILRMQENPDLDSDAAINQVMETEGLPKSLYDQAVRNVQERKADATDVTDDAEPVPGGVEPSIPAPSGGLAVESEATGQLELPIGRGVDVGSVDTGVDTGRGGVSQPALDIAPIQQPKIKLAERVKAAEPVAIAALDIVTGGQVVEGLNGNTRRSILSTAKNTMAQKAAKGVEFDPVNEVRAAFETKGIALPEVTTAPEVTTTPEVTAAPNQTFEDIGEPSSNPAKDFVEAMYAENPEWPYGNDREFVLVHELDENGQAAKFSRVSLKPSGKNMVSLDWISSFPMGEGVGGAALETIKQRAAEAGVGLTLVPWSNGRVSVPKLVKFYKKHGFTGDKSGMKWMPEAQKAAPTKAAAKATPARAPKKVKAQGATQKANGKAIKAVIERKPGKTVAEKVFNIAQAELEATPKDDLIEQADVTPFDPEYETIRAKPGINAVRMAKMLGPQLYGDPTNMGQVSIKEVLQNSFDATRSAVDNGQIELGTIDIRVSDGGRTLTVKDNGVGMTPEILGGKFLEIAGTGKEGDKNAGGFGIAKMLFLYANKNIRVVTARDGRIAEMNVTGEQLFESLDDPEQAPDIEIRYFEPVDYEAFPVGHGTIIQLTIPEQDGDYKIKQLPSWLDSIPALELSPLFSNIEVTFQGRSYTDPETVEVGANFPIRDYTQFVGVKFPWGTAKVYITRNETGQKYGENMHILSNGLWQFSTTVRKDPSNMWSDIVPYRFYVDIVPSVKPDQPGYPFNFNRQSFTGDAERDFRKVKSYIDAIYAYKSRAGEATSFGNIQYFDANGVLGPIIDLTPDIPVQDTSFTRVGEGDQITVGEDGSLLVNGQPMPELTPDQLKAGIPSERELLISPDLIDTNAVMVHDNADVVIQSTGERMPIPEFMRRQFGERFDEYTRYVGETFLTLRNEVARVMGYRGLLDEAVGISLDPEYRGVSIRLPFSGSFINPLVPKYGDGLRAGYGIFGTMIHELAHHKVRSHNANFPAEMQDILLNMEADEGFAYQRFKDNFADTIAARYGDIIKFGVEIFNGANPDITVELRGNRFTEGSGEQAPEGTGAGGTGDVRGPSGAGSTGESLLGAAYERRGDAGAGEQRGAGAGQSAEQFGEQLKLSKAQIARAKQFAGVKQGKISKVQRKIAQTRRAEAIAKGQLELGRVAKGEDTNISLLAATWPSLPQRVRSAFLSLLPTVDIMRLAKKLDVKNLAEADRIVVEDMRRFDVRENERLAEQLEQLARTFKKDPTAVPRLMDVMVSAVANDVDPTLAATPEEYAAKHDKKYQQRQAALAADPNNKGLKSSLSRRMNEIKSVYVGIPKGDPRVADGEGIAGWTDINPAMKRAFATMKKAHRRDLEEYYKALKERVAAQITDPEGQKAAIAELDKQFKPVLDNVIYFPMMRHGQFYVRTSEEMDGKAEPGFYMFESEAEAKNFAEGMADVDGVEVLDSGNVTELQKTKGRGAEPLAKAINMLGEGVNANELKNELSRLYLSTLPGNSMKARFAKRKLRAGYSTDILKSFMAARESSKRATKAITYSHKLDAAISSARDAVKGTPNAVAKRDIINELELRVAAELNPTPTGFGWEAIVRFGNKAAFYWYLATPKSALIQLTQMHIVSLPMLATKYNTKDALASLTKYGFTGLGQVVKSPITALSLDADGNVEWNWEQPKIINSDLLQSLHKDDPNMLELITEGWEYGKELNIYMETFASDVTGAGQPSAQSLAEGMTDTTLRSFRNVAGFMASSFHQMERVNREATYMAALELGYRKNIKDGMSHEDAKQKAMTDAAATTLEATFDFSEYNKPRVMSKGVGRMAFQFYMYPVSMFSLLGRNSFGAIKNYKDAAKNIADPQLRKKLVAQANSDALVALGMLVNIGLYGGLTALPFFGASILIASAFYAAFGDDEDFIDPETGAVGPAADIDYWFRNEWIPGFFGPGGTVAAALGLSDEQAEMLALAAERGPISALTDLDLTNSVALDLLWFVPEAPRSDDPSIAAAEMTLNFLGGATGGVALDLVKSGQQVKEGEFLRSLETAPRFIGNAAKAVRYKTEGQNTYADLLVGVPSEMYTNADMFGQMLGFASTAAAKELESGYGVKRVIQAAKDAKASIREDAAKIAAEDARTGSSADFNSPEWQDVFERMLQHNRRYSDNILLPSELEESYLNKYFGILESEAGAGVEFEDLRSSRAALREYERRQARRNAQ